MNVGKLIEVLSELPEDYEVVVLATKTPEPGDSSYGLGPEYDTFEIESGDTGHCHKVIRLDIDLDNPL